MGRTKVDTTRHPADGLSVPQIAAVDALLAGATDAEASAVAGVTRQTISGWKNHHPAVVACLNAARQASWERSADRLRNLVPMAITALEAALDGPNPDARVALDVLRLTGIADRGAPLTPTGPTTAAAVLDAEIIARRVADDPLAAILGGRPTAGERQVLAAELAALMALGAGE